MRIRDVFYDNFVPIEFLFHSLRRANEMKLSAGKRLTLIGFLVIVLLAPGWVTAQTKFGRIVVFGTSLSDPGNAFALIGQMSLPPYNTLDQLLVPSAPYGMGGHHFSNGATWIEQFARPLGLAGNTRPAFQGPNIEATNYAVGGARARNVGSNTLSVEVDAFLHDFNGAAPPDALYVVEMGANDIRDAIAVLPDLGQASAIISNALTEISNNIVALHAAGANKFLIWNAPNLRLTPAVRILDKLFPGTGLAAEGLTQSFNTGLDALLGSLAGSGIEIARLDAYKTLNDLVANPGAFGLAVVDTACVTPDIPPFECHMPNEFLFWDGIHPTAAVHAIIAQEVAVLLTQ
jgi:phospholipase/lecithinase/hemolysin